MPKVQYQALQHGVSARTVLAAYRQLLDEGTVHRHGRRWFAGPRPVHVTPTPSHGPCIVLCQTEPGGVQKLAEHQVWQPFMNAFIREAENAHVELLPVLTRSEMQVPGLFPCGKDAIRSTVERLGSRYLGSLVLFTDRGMHDVEQTDWLRFLSEL
jgi:hypothetical protein